jgi:hypothetical protein
MRPYPRPPARVPTTGTASSGPISITSRPLPDPAARIVGCLSKSPYQLVECPLSFRIRRTNADH